MSVEKLPDGRGYKVRWRDSAGRSRRKTVTLWRDAVALDGEMKRKRAMGELIAHEKGKITLEDFWRIWWLNYALPALAPRTQAVYGTLWRTHVIPALGPRTRVREISRETVTAAVSQWSTSLAPSSVRGVCAVLQSVLQRAVEWDYIATNPCRGIKKPKLSSRRGRALTATQVSKLCSELDARGQAVVGLLASSGLRPGELRELTWGMIGAESIEVYAPKTNRRRTVTLRDEARRAFVEWYVASGQPADSALVFPSADAAGPWTDNGYRLWVRQTLKPAAKRAGLGDVRPYDLRHTFATTLIYEGMPPHEVARQLGHSVVVCMTTYAHEFESVPSECPANLHRAENFRARLGI